MGRRWLCATTIAAVGVVAVVVAGCGPTGSPGPSGTAAPPSTTAAAATPGGTGPPVPSVGAPIVPADPAGTPAGTAGTAPTGTACVLADLTVRLGPPGSGAQPRTSLVWTNTGARTCTMSGFPGTTLAAAGDPAAAARYPVPWTGGDAPTVTLAPGADAHSVLTYLPADPARDAVVAPATVLVIAPGDTRAALLPWPAGPVLDQRGTPRPGTTVGPVEPGGA